MWEYITGVVNSHSRYFTLSYGLLQLEAGGHHQMKSTDPQPQKSDGILKPLAWKISTTFTRNSVYKIIFYRISD